MAARWSSSRTIPPWRPTPTGSSDSVTGGSHRTTCSIVLPVPAHERVLLPDVLSGNPRGLAALRLFLRLHRARRGRPVLSGPFPPQTGTRHPARDPPAHSRPSRTTYLP